MSANGDFVGVQIGGKFGNIYQNFKIMSPTQQFYVCAAIPGKMFTHVQKQS